MNGISPGFSHWTTRRIAPMISASNVSSTGMNQSDSGHRAADLRSRDRGAALTVLPFLDGTSHPRTIDVRRRVRSPIAVGPALTSSTTMDDAGCPKLGRRRTLLAGKSFRQAWRRSDRSLRVGTGRGFRSNPLAPPPVSCRRSRPRLKGQTGQRPGRCAGGAAGAVLLTVDSTGQRAGVPSSSCLSRAAGGFPRCWSTGSTTFPLMNSETF